MTDVVFAYPARSDQTVLDHFNLTLQPHTVTALVGMSGSGKSSIAKLLMRFYDPQSGSIAFDGHDLRTLNLQSLRSQLACVSQEPPLFSGTIEDNIRFGSPRDDVTMEEVVAAAKVANAHEFIMALPQQYKTNTGERGVLLSGGQKQRIAIARCVLANPSLLILDEATSALDSASEKIVEAALARLMQGRTVLIISHRLASIVRADAIVVMHQGKMVERGTHAELVKLNGYYAHYLSRQRI